MEKFRIIVDRKEYEVEKDKTLAEISEQFKGNFEYPIILAKVNNSVKELKDVIEVDNSRVEFLDLASKEGYLCYQRSVSFMLNAAIFETLGSKAKVSIKHSINKNHYFNISGFEATEENLAKIKTRMLEFVANDVKIEHKYLKLAIAEELCKKESLLDKQLYLKYSRKDRVGFYKLNDYYNSYDEALCQSCGMLTVFDINYYENGLIIEFPRRENPYELTEFKPLDKITEVFEESKRWSDILQVSNSYDINEMHTKDKIHDLIRVTESFHEKRISEIADQIKQKGKKIVLIAGPTSSGKTSFAKRLCIHLKIIGLKPHVIGLDDYYKERSEIPFDENGKQNFESVDTLELDMINRDLKRMLSGEEVEVPHFNFKEGKKEYKGRKIKMGDDDVLVMEGIHGLNEIVTEQVSQDVKFKIFISPLTQINVDATNRISTRDTRILRRITRDNRTRGANAKTTISMWPDVVAGEQKNIFPYQEEADEIFNSALIYELGVIKPYVEPILFNVSPEDEEYSEARRLLEFLHAFLALPSDSIPETSVIREFIGGSCFE